MSKYVNTSGHEGPEWVLSSVGIVEKITQLLEGTGSIEVYGVNTSRSNIPMAVEVSSSRGLDTLTFKEMDAEVVGKQIREHFGLNSLQSEEELDVPSVLEVKDSDERDSISPNVESFSSRDEKSEVPDVQFIPSPVLVEEVETPKSRKK